LRRIAELASSGMNLEGIRHVMSLEEEVVRLRHEVAELRQALMDAVNALENNSRGALVPLRQAVTLFGELPSIFHPHR
jgi:MerR family transcriptional regulator/heat shock protein HspR